MKEHLNNTANTKESTDEPKVKKIETYCDMGFENTVGLNSFQINLISFA